MRGERGGVHLSGLSWYFIAYFILFAPVPVVVDNGSVAYFYETEERCEKARVEFRKQAIRYADADPRELYVGWSASCAPVSGDKKSLPIPPRKEEKKR